MIERISESTPPSRQSPNAIYVGDVLIGTAHDGQPFKGRVTKILGRTVVLENGFGGSQWCELSTLRTTR